MNNLAVAKLFAVISGVGVLGAVVAIFPTGGLEQVNPTAVPPVGRLVYQFGALVGLLAIGIGLRVRIWTREMDNERYRAASLAFVMIGGIFIIYAVGGLLGRTQTRWELWTVGLFAATVLFTSVYWVLELARHVDLAETDVPTPTSGGDTEMTRGEDRSERRQ